MIEDEVRAVSVDREFIGIGQKVKEQSQRMGVYSLFYLSRAIINLKLKDIDITVVSNCVNNVTGQEERINPENASFFGIGNVIEHESPEIRCRCIDIDASTRAEDIIPKLYADGLYTAAYRNGQRYIQEFGQKDIESEADTGFSLKSDGAYIITGGTGGIGLETAKFLASKRRINLVLLSQSGMPAREKWNQILLEGKDSGACKRINAINEIEYNGTTVTCFSVDIAKYDEVNAVFKTVRSRFGKINGIIHGAGVANNELMASQKEKDFSGVLFPKVFGTWILDKLTESGNLDFFCLLSSIATIFSSSGQGDYAAANAYLDSFAAFRKKQGKRTLTINWSTWRDAGMAADNGVNIDTICKAIDTETAMKGFEKALEKDVILI